MPINIPKHLPAAEKLREEKIFVMDTDRAVAQDIRPLNILILNLMPEKERTELQLLRLLGNTPLQVDVTFMTMATHESKNTSKSHLDEFYVTFEDIQERRFDGMIITGAPIEHLPFEEVNYWDELTRILDWSDRNVTSTMTICWGAQAALYHFYGIGKQPLQEKCFGVFRHTVTDPTVKLARGFSDLFVAPHSRYTEVSAEEIRSHPDLDLLSESEEAGAFIVLSKDEKRIMITGHLEYDAGTLAEEYRRDRAKGLDTAIPKHYFPQDDPENVPLNTWRSHTFLLFSNWLNYYVYQETPYVWA